jgi:hypothetical protein
VDLLERFPELQLPNSEQRQNWCISEGIYLQKQVAWLEHPWMMTQIVAMRATTLEEEMVTVVQNKNR